MKWFDRISANRYVTTVLLADDQGRILRSSRPLRSDEERIASMLQSVEVLAQSLAAELWNSLAEMIHITTDSDHLLVFPLSDSRYVALVMLPRTAPLLLLLVEIRRALAEVEADELHALAQQPRVHNGDNTVMDPEAQELIDAVQEWLNQQRMSDEE